MTDTDDNTLVSVLDWPEIIHHGTSVIKSQRLQRSELKEKR